MSSASIVTLAGVSTAQQLATLTANPYVMGSLMVLLNLGGRFLSMGLTPKQEEVLRGPALRPLLLFGIVFAATRQVAVALYTTAAVFLVLWLLANEHSAFCVVPGWRAAPAANSAAYASAVPAFVEGA